MSPTPMNTRGSITLGDLWSRVTMLEVACHRCDRHGRLSLARLIAQHGEGMGLPDLRHILAGDCPDVRAAAFHERCAVHFPTAGSVPIARAGLNPMPAVQLEQKFIAWRCWPN